MVKKFLVTVSLITTMVGVLVGCGGNTSDSSVETTEATETTEVRETTETTEATETTETEATKEVSNSSSVDQLAMPKKGDTVATISVKDYGDMKVRFFADQAPKAVENFITHAKEGYYDGVTFHRIIDDFMIQGGDPQGNGMGGESIWGEAFEDEFSEDLIPIRGALCMANAGPNTNGSQFFIVQAKTANATTFDPSISYTEEQVEKFEEQGGTPWLKGKHTVFGQVYEGMDVVDKIAGTKVNAEGSPEEPVIIEHITVETYEH